MRGGRLGWQDRLLCRRIIRLHLVHASITVRLKGVTLSTTSLPIMQNRHTEFEQYLQKALLTWTSPHRRQFERRFAVKTTLPEWPLPQATNANRLMGSTGHASCARQPSRWVGLTFSKSGSKPVATTSLSGLMAQWRNTNRFETIIWLTVAAAAFAVLILSLSLAA